MKKEEAKQLTLSRLRALLQKLKEMKPEDFTYRVYRAPDGRRCPAGMHPIWFPETGLVDDGHTVSHPKEFPSDVLKRWYNVHGDIIGVMFYGYIIYIQKPEKPVRLYVGSDGTLKQVAYVIENVIEAVEKDIPFVCGYGVKTNQICIYEEGEDSQTKKTLDT